MRILAKFGLLSALLALPISTFAFEQTSFDYPQIQTAYQNAVNIENARMSKITSLSSADKARLVKAENRLISALSALQTAYRTGDSTKIRKATTTAKSAGSFFSFTVKSLKNEAKRPGNTSAVAASSATVLSPTVSNSSDEAVSILYYADSFNGAHTSLGDTFSQWTFSSAKCNTPLASLLEVKYGGKSVVVKLNDRPNCEKHPDIVDLSKVAFESLAPISKGRMSGNAHSLGTVDKEYKKNYLDLNTFSDLGVTLDEKTPNTYKQGESIKIGATVKDGKTDAVFFMKTPSGKKLSLSMEVINSRVSFYYPLDEVWKYELVVASGMGFSTTKMEKVYVLPKTIYEAKHLDANSDTIAPLKNIAFERRESGDLSGMDILPLPSDTYRENTVTISAGGKTVTRTAMGDAAFLLSDFVSLSAEKEAKVTIQTARSTTPFSLDVYEVPKTIYERTIPLVSSYKKENKETGKITIRDSGITLSLKTPKNISMRPDIYLIMPSGRVKTAHFGSEYIGTDGYLVKDRSISASIDVSEKGQYIAEIMYSTGFPAFNEPFSFGTDVAATLPNEYDITSKDSKSDFGKTRENALVEINKLRKKIDLGEVVLDVNLTNLAQYKANDMAANNYVGHADSFGKTIGETAKRAGIAIEWSIGENVAGGTVSADFLIAGLSLSGGHRANILGESWTKLGIGAVEKNGMIYLVEIFGE